MSKPGAGSPPNLIWLFHLYQFLQLESFHSRREDLANAITQAQQLVELLRDPALVPAMLDVRIEEHSLQTALLDVSMKSLLLTEYIKVVQADIRDLQLPPWTVIQFQVILKQILERVSLQIDNVTFYIRPTEADQQFESWLFNPSLPFSDEFESFFQNFTDLPRKEFSQVAFGLFSKLRTVFSFIDSIGFSCGLILFFRAIFARAFSENPRYFYRNEPGNLTTIAELFPVESLEVSPEFLPDHPDGSTVFEVFKDLELFQRAASHLAFTCFFTNPIDALFEIHEVIHILEQFTASITPETGTKILPFETVFGLFIAAILMSDIPNFEELAAFVGDFAPEGCLCQDFLFAFSTSQAAAKYCRTLPDLCGGKVNG
jgi:hypothetical protein